MSDSQVQTLPLPKDAPISTVLTATRAVIANPENWTQEVYAKDANGEQTNCTNSKATCFCLMGAVGKVTGNDLSIIALPAYQYLQTVLDVTGHNITPPHFNDTHTHQEVLEFLDCAIEEATKQGI